MILPIWVASWEIECCQPDAIVGQPWAAPFVRLGPPEPWWIGYADTPPPADVMELGVTELEGEVAKASTDQHPGVFRTEAFRVVVPGPLPADTRQLRGRLGFEGHDGPGVEDQRLDISGIVRRVRGIPLVYEVRDRMHIPIGQDAPVDVDSTTVRGFPEYLVDVEVRG